MYKIFVRYFFHGLYGISFSMKLKTFMILPWKLNAWYDYRTQSERKGIRFSGLKVTGI